MRTGAPDATFPAKAPEGTAALLSPPLLLLSESSSLLHAVTVANSTATAAAATIRVVYGRRADFMGIPFGVAATCRDFVVRQELLIGFVREMVGFAISSVVPEARRRY
ncbi:hypothetical protein [Gordonia sp. SL306]|uniref:hypothetical protein n=1 Tax=Gordonia sp. SL306 TaxID=2995145 RepID=UPI00226E4D22|nr:hypothetical protein [Gordonia sp. SL306]WAC54017.1 hypothetical protein OVA31_15090 [Gordonia sp. SL306]